MLSTGYGSSVLGYRRLRHCFQTVGLGGADRTVKPAISPDRKVQRVREFGFGRPLEGTGYLNGRLYLLYDRDQKFCREFRETLPGDGLKCLTLPARSPSLNSYSERWVHSVKPECLNQLILFGEGETSVRITTREEPPRHGKIRDWLVVANGGTARAEGLPG
jgi:hypothetical protein